MKRFNITVNGKAYDVAVEELDSSAARLLLHRFQLLFRQHLRRLLLLLQDPAKRLMRQCLVRSLDVKVNVGDTVSKGQVIMILEAMKMENDIVASCDGKITSVLAKKGDTVNSGDALATIG